jgi:hypothetical protein
LLPSQFTPGGELLSDCGHPVEKQSKQNLANYHNRSKNITSVNKEEEKGFFLSLITDIFEAIFRIIWWLISKIWLFLIIWELISYFFPGLWIRIQKIITNF